MNDNPHPIGPVLWSRAFAAVWSWPNMGRSDRLTLAWLVEVSRLPRLGFPRYREPTWMLGVRVRNSMCSAARCIASQVGGTR